MVTLPFMQTFGGSPHLEVLKELFTQVRVVARRGDAVMLMVLVMQIFSTPCYHPKSKPFIDHVFHFGIMDGRIWFRNYQVY